MDKYLDRHKYIVLGFFIPFIILIGISILMQFAPFGGYSLLISDFNASYIEQIASFRRILLGEDSFFYSWSQIQGSTPYGFINLSVFNIFTVFIEEELLPAYVTCITILKIAFAGSSFSFYLKKVFKKNDINISMFGWCYALMGYIVAQHYHIMWLDHMIALPIILYGVEKIIYDYKKWGLFCGLLTFAFINGYYLSYMTGIFSFLYFIYRYLSINSKIDFIELRNKIGVFILAPTVALGLSAFYIVPVLSMMQGRDGIFNGSDLVFFLRYEFTELISKLFIGTFDTFLPGGIPFLYCGIIVVVLVVMYFYNPYITYKQKVLSFSLLAFMIISLTINPLYVAWQGFKPPVYFEGRFSYLVSFLMIVLAYQSYCYIDSISRKTVNNIFVLIVAIVILFNRSEHNYISDKGLTFTVVFLIGYYGVIIYRTKENCNKLKIAAITAWIVAIELAINSYLTFGALDNITKYPFVSEYNDIRSQLKDVSSTIMAEDDDKYRIEFVNKRSMNDGFGIGFPSISHFDSVYNYDTKEAVGRLGIATGHNWIQYSGSTPIVDTLMNIKYVATEEDKYMGYEYLYDQGFNTIFRNPYALSIGFMIADDLNEVKEASDPLQFQSDILNNMLGESGIKYYRNLVPVKEEVFNVDVVQEKFDKDEQNTEAGYIDVIDSYDLKENVLHEKKGGITLYKKDNRQEAKKVYSLKTTKDGSCFMHIQPTKEYMVGDKRMAVQIKVNGEEIIQEEKTPGLVYYLGEFKRNDNIVVELVLINSDLQYEDINFYEFEEEQFQNAINNLAKGKLEITEHGHRFIKGKISVVEEMPYLYLSIPYDQGWKLFVNGKEYDIQKIYNGFMGAKLESGEYSIFMKYEPVGLKQGIIISSITMFCILLYKIIIIYRKMTKNNKI